VRTRLGTRAGFGGRRHRRAVVRLGGPGAAGGSGGDEAAGVVPGDVPTGVGL
jgi:hypothetical protein